MKFILAEKKEMTQKFSEDGAVIPVTKVVAGPCVIAQIKNMKKDGYTAVQIGFGNKKKISKPLQGHLKNLENFQYLREFKINSEEVNNLKVGDRIEASTFKQGDLVNVSGISKGKGFQGVVKRHGFHGSPASHGHKDQLRMPGSIGAGGPHHVFKGTRMSGRMGGEAVSVKNLEIIEVDEKGNEIFIKGALPGAKSNLLLISSKGDLVVVKPVKKIEMEEKKEENQEEVKDSGDKLNDSVKNQVPENKKDLKGSEPSKEEGKKSDK